MSRPAVGRTLTRALAGTAVALAALAVPATAEPPAADAGRIPGAWIVTLDEGTTPARVTWRALSQPA